MDGFLGEIRMFAGNFAPRAWMLCQGQIISIAQNTALFSILGTTYGGDGRVTFGIPDLRGRRPVGNGQGPGVSAYVLGQMSGNETHTMQVNELAAHNHPSTNTSTLKCSSNPAADPDPKNNFMATAAANTYLDTSNTTMGAGAVDVQLQIGNTGTSTPFDILDPTCCLNFIICVEGIFPSRN